MEQSNLKRSLMEIVFTYTYPRLDVEVSKHMNHLLKAPQNPAALRMSRAGAHPGVPRGLNGRCGPPPRGLALQAPFCVHPKTGRVCVPIDPEKAEDFDPLARPDPQPALPSERERESEKERVSPWSD